MKLSEIIKQEMPLASKPAPPAPSAPANIKPQAPQAKPSPAPVVPAVNPEEIERKIREDLEKEFMEKLEKMKQELRSLTDEKLKDEEQRRLELKKSQEEYFSRQLRDEKERMEQELRRKVEETQFRQRDEIQKSFSEQEKELAEKKRQAEEAARKLESERRVFEEKAKADLEAAQRRIVELEQKYYVSGATKPAPESPEKPQTEFRMPVKNNATISEIEGLYESLVRAGNAVLNSISHSEPFDLEEISAALARVRQSVREHDSDWIELIAQPYPENADYFTFHLANCAVLSMIIGDERGMSEETLADLSLAGFLHDIGLLGVRESLDYPKELTAELKTEVLKHPERSVALLGNLINEEVAAALLQHHETFNGKGYPKGLMGEKIHIFARIIHIADSFEAMTHHRPYRQKPMEVSEALKEMVDRGRHVYDRDVLKALMNRIGLYPVMSLVELSNKQIVRVIKQSRKHPLSPVVQVEFDEDGNKLKEPKILELSKTPLLHIIGPVKSIHSYGKERLEHQHRHRTSHGNSKTPMDFVAELIPFILFVIFVLFLVYLLFKI